MPSSLDSGTSLATASTALEPGRTPRMPVPRSKAESRPEPSVETLYRVGQSHLYLANSFQEGLGKAYRGEIQKVLQTLRWDPIDGHLLALATRPVATTSDGGLGGDPTPAGDRATATWRFDLRPEVANWLRSLGLDRDLSDKHGTTKPGLSLLELDSCIAMDPNSGQGARDALAALEAQRVSGKLAVYAASARFFWRRSYHLALPVGIGLDGPTGAHGRWHAEGGQYQDRAPIYDAPVWRRRSRRSSAVGPFDPLSGGAAGLENARPADSFDPRPAYLFDGLEADSSPAAEAQGIRFQPFVLRVGGLEPWPRNPLLQNPAESGQTSQPLDREQSRLAAWYRPCPDTLTMRWMVSPRLGH